MLVIQIISKIDLEMLREGGATQACATESSALCLLGFGHTALSHGGAQSRWRSVTVALNHGGAQSRWRSVTVALSLVSI